MEEARWRANAPLWATSVDPRPAHHAGHALNRHGRKRANGRAANQQFGCKGLISHGRYLQVPSPNTPTDTTVSVTLTGIGWPLLTQSPDPENALSCWSVTPDNVWIGVLAERVGFEPTVSANPQRFSRPSQSTTLAPLRKASAGGPAGDRAARLAEAAGLAKPLGSPPCSPYIQTMSTRPHTVDSPAPPPAIAHARFGIGEVVRHRLFGFRGVIFDVDPVFANSEEWYQAIPEDVRPAKDQPFYHLLAENAEASYVAYVSQQNIERDESDEPIDHPAIAGMFDAFDGERYPLRRELRH